jgi:Protein of unknown function (DUF3048) N-terminal domain/Protein of unknown function (DUF3048) C-terminal domain
VIRNRTSRATVALLLASGLVVAACSGGDEAAPTTPPATRATTTSTSTTTSTTTTLPPTLPPPSTPAPVSTTIAPDILRMPLTGEPIASADEIPNRPAMAVKIDNIGSAIPQSGLNEADIVFEEIINAGATRFAAVFHSQDVDPLGPVRSGRYPDILMLEAFDRPLFVWSGGNPGVTFYIRQSKMVNLSAVETSGYYRRRGKNSPHNLYTTTQAMWEKTPPDFAIPPVVLPYLRPNDTLTGEPATVINLTMDNNDVRWEYNPEDGLYYRWQNGKPHNTENSGQVTTKNLIVMTANYIQSPIDAKTPDAQMLGSSPVFIFTGGTVRIGVWLRFESTDRYQFFDSIETLNELRIQPGRSFIELPRAIPGTVTWS